MKENKKNIRLKVAIILASALLILVIVVETRDGRKRLPVVPEVNQEERVQEVHPVPPKLRELEKTGFRQELEEEFPILRLEDIPFEQIIEEVEGALEEEKGALDLVPSPEELKRIKEEGAVLF